MADLLDDLRAGELVHDHTDEAVLRQLLDSILVTLYCRIAPSADSLYGGRFRAGWCCVASSRLATAPGRR